MKVPKTLMVKSVTPVKDDIDMAPAAQGIVVDNGLRGGTGPRETMS